LSSRDPEDLHSVDERDRVVTGVSGRMLIPSSMTATEIATVVVAAAYS